MVSQDPETAFSELPPVSTKANFEKDGTVKTITPSKVKISQTCNSRLANARPNGPKS